MTEALPEIGAHYRVGRTVYAVCALISDGAERIVLCCRGPDALYCNLSLFRRIARRVRAGEEEAAPVDEGVAVAAS
ncbi:MAG TPA: hypothetical protein VEB20_16110 [Azospirillaceae bacterium]|nr:hypothetical protein [Azospirillaceae bacterium]